jgi:CheY-like chemotaxis protein
MMPIMDGWEFMAALRANPRWQDIPIVIITAVYDVARTQRETGVKAIITKPFDIDQLADVVKLYAS